MIDAIFDVIAFEKSLQSNAKYFSCYDYENQLSMGIFNQEVCFSY